MKALTLAGKAAGWLASLAVFAFILVAAYAAHTRYEPRDAMDWASRIATIASYMLIVIALNPLSWRFAPFNSIARRLLLAALGVASAVLLTVFAPDVPRSR